jgi:hypothetical protein
LDKDSRHIKLCNANEDLLGDFEQLKKLVIGTERRIKMAVDLHAL